MAIGDIHYFGAAYTYDAGGRAVTQHTSTSSANNIEDFYLYDTNHNTRRWIESYLVNDVPFFIGADFLSVNNDPLTLTQMYGKCHYSGHSDFLTVLLTEQEWQSLPDAVLSKIAWENHPNVYALTSSLYNGQAVWVRYENGKWKRRMHGSLKGNECAYANGFIPVMYDCKHKWKPSGGDNNNTIVQDKVEKLNKTLHIGSQKQPFGVRYTVRDLDYCQKITVTEKLNGKTIVSISDFNTDSYGIVKITRHLFDQLENNVLHTIEIVASDGVDTDSYFITFRKTNNPPIITRYCSSDFGAISEKPLIEYSVNDIDGDIVNVTEKINKTSIRTYKASLNQRYSVSLTDEFWNKCNEDMNTVEIVATDSNGATTTEKITFAKAVPQTTYTVFYAVEGDIRYERVFESIDGTEEARGYTYTFDTLDTNMDFSLAEIAEGTQIKVWMVAHNPYASSVYKSSNILTFKKATYGKPIVSSPFTNAFLAQDHSEYGTLTILYEHEDVEIVYGSYVSKDPDRAIEDFEAKVDIHCFVNGKYKCLYALSDNTIQVGTEKTFKIDFNKISPGARSCEIRYLVVLTDKQSGIKTTTIQPASATAVDLLPGSHYYNDEPGDPVIKYEYKDIFEGNKYEYEFQFINLYWDSLVDNDKDNSMYYLYLKTPESFKESVVTESVPSRSGPNAISYNRKYRIFESYNENSEVIGCTVEYFNGSDYVQIQENKGFVGLHINYLSDHLGKEWPENEEFSFYVEARDTRPWENSYYGLSDLSNDGAKYHRRKHVYPHEVDLTIIPNIVDGLGDGEKGRISVLYTHPEILDQSGIVDIYAYQDGQLVSKVYSGEFYHNQEQTITIDFAMYEYKSQNDAEKRLQRSKDVTYYAVATDILGFCSLTRFNDIPIKAIPYIEPDEDGNLSYMMIYSDGVQYDFNNRKTYTYEGPVQKGKHYFNEEPPATTPQEINPTLIGYESVAIKWPHVVDPDGDEVKYEIYVASSVSGYNIEQKEFFSDNQPDENDYIEEAENTKALVSTLLNYHKVVEIPASVAEEYSKEFEVSIKEYIEDSTVNLWIVSKDPYVNSYYRSGEIINVPKGHEGKEIRIAYPRNDSVVYAKTPRILIYLGEDNLEQTTYVQWLEGVYNNRDHPEYFSNGPNTRNIVVFKPPMPYTGVSGNKVTFSVWVHNRCTYGPKTYVTFTYKDFFDSFDDNKLIPIKSSHVNAFREAINVTRDAYGLDQVKFSRKITKDMLFENFDFNETKQAIMDINDKINNADPGDSLDYINPLIVDVNDLDLVQYEGSLEAGSYEEFLEWARLLYILENL